jgi:hypothetical protein
MQIIQRHITAIEVAAIHVRLITIASAKLRCEPTAHLHHAAPLKLAQPSENRYGTPSLDIEWHYCNRKVGRSRRGINVQPELSSAT